jgi:hypothetical protein
MRWLTLYLRSRSAPAALVAALGATAALWWLHHAIDDPQPRPLLALLAALAGTAAIAPGLAGADHDLDRTAAIAWPPRRAAHLTTGAAIVAGLLAATALTGDPFAHAAPIARDVLGLGGLVALGAAILGAARAPLLPVTWTLLVLRFSPALGGTPPTQPGWKQALTWMIQPAGTTSATVAAVLLGVAGVLAYAVFGPRR